MEIDDGILQFLGDQAETSFQAARAEFLSYCNSGDPDDPATEANINSAYGVMIETNAACYGIQSLRIMSR